MSKRILWLISLLFVVSCSFVSCEEPDGAVDPYTDWQERNEHYLDSIASVALANQGEAVGQWKVIHTYKYPQQGITMGDVDEYIYCKVLEVGDGETPLYKDAVKAHYRGWLIPLYDGREVVFDQSYQGSLDKDVAIPVEFDVNGVVEGWTTALQEMKVGDRWLIYIPSDMGYGDTGSSSIPGYSTLIFDLSLAGVERLKGNPQD